MFNQQRYTGQMFSCYGFELALQWLQLLRCARSSLLQKSFSGAGKTLFVGAGAAPVPVFCSQRLSFPGLGVGQGTNRPWKQNFRGGSFREPTLKIEFSGAVDAFTCPQKCFYMGGSWYHSPLETDFPPTRFQIFKSVSRCIKLFKFLFPTNLHQICFSLYLNFCFPPIFTYQASALFYSAFPNLFPALFKFLFPTNFQLSSQRAIQNFVIDDEYIS